MAGGDGVRNLGLGDLGFLGAVDRSNRWNAAIDLRTNINSGSQTNPNGPWAYGYTTTLDSSSVTLVTTQAASGYNGPFAFNTPLFETDGISISSHTPIDGGSNRVTVLRWISPYAGNVLVNATFTKTVAGGNGVSPRIYKNSSLLFDGGVIISPGTLSASYYSITGVAIGDALYFNVGDNGSSEFDTFRYTVEIVGIP